LVMDYAPGGTLRTLHPQGARLPLETVIRYVKQVAQALQYAHQQRLIHRDLKPSVQRCREAVLTGVRN
jgi:eukaryotic-like serine/threonine-protein kinase